MSGADGSDENMPITVLRRTPSAVTASQSAFRPNSPTRSPTAPPKPLASSLMAGDGEDSDDLIVEDEPPLRTAPTDRRRLRKGRDAILVPPRAPAPACSDSEDELLAVLPTRDTWTAAPPAPATAVKPPASADAEPPSIPPSDSEDDASELGGSDEEYMLRGAAQGGRRSKPVARGRVGATASGSDGSDSGSDGGPTLGKSGGLKRRRGANAIADKPMPRPAKPQQPKHSILSESDTESEEPNPRGVSAKACGSQLTFSDAPKKEVDIRRLPNSAFLVVPTLAKRSEWKLPYKDVQGRVNVSLLHAARLAVRTNTLNKKPMPFTVKPELESKIERLWREAKAWHRARRPQAAATVANAAKSVGRFQRPNPKQPDESDEEEMLGAALQKTTNPSAPTARAGKNPTASDSESEENDTLGSLLDKPSTAPDVAAAQPEDMGPAAAAESASEAGEPAEEQEVGGELEISFADDEEAEYLAQYEQGRQRAQVKERFWRRDAFIADDDDEEEEGERSEGEALEEGERRGPLPVRVGRLNDEQMYDLLHSESQRLLRKQKGALPCRKDKALSLKSLISSIERRHAEARAEVAPAPAPAEEAEEPKTDRLLCLRCTKLLTTKDAPVFETQTSKAAAGIFCSTLCLRMHRLAPAARSAAASQETQEAEASQVSQAGCASDDDDEPLVVLPSGATPKAARSRIKLERLVKHDCAVSLQARGSLLRKLRGEASGIRKEEARLSGKYVEESQSSTDWFQSQLEEDDADADDEEALASDEQLDDEDETSAGLSPQAEDDEEVEAPAADETGCREETSEPAAECRADEAKTDAAGEDVASASGDGAYSEPMESLAAEPFATQDIVNSASSAVEVEGVADAAAAQCEEQRKSVPSRLSTSPAPSRTKAASEESNRNVQPTPAAAQPVAAPASAPSPAPVPAPAPAASTGGLTSMFGRTFARRPQQSTLQFGTMRRPRAESEPPAARVEIPAPVADVLEAMQQQEDEEDAKQLSPAELAPQPGVAEGMEEEAESEQPRKRRKPALVDDEAEESGDEEAGEGEEADASVDSEGGEDSDELVEGDVETSHGALLAEQARRAAAADEDEVDAVLRGLQGKRRRGRRVEEELLAGLDGGDDRDESPGAAKAARRGGHQRSAADEDAADGASDDELRSLDDFIADDDSEAEVELEPEVEAEEEGEEAEDESAKIIRSKLGDDWVVGDRSAPALICDDEGDKQRATALRESLKRKREMEVQLKRNISEQSSLENEQSSAGSAWVVPGDDKSTTMWQLLSESHSSSAGYTAKRPERQPSAPKPAPMAKSFAAAAAVNPVSAPPMLRKFGSFNDKRGSDLAQRLGQGPATSFSKAFVFRDDSSSHATNGDGGASNASSTGKAWQSGYESSRAGNAQRRPLGRVPSANAPVEKPLGASLLAKVLGSKKNWAAAKRS